MSEQGKKTCEKNNHNLHLNDSCPALIWINVHYVHAAWGTRRAWLSFSCRCVSTGEACQTPGSPFQRCQRTIQVLSDARIENNDGEKQRNVRALASRLQKDLWWMEI